MNDKQAVLPLIWADVPDPDVIRVGDTYYMSSTTMYFCPGVPIMKSTDMLNWEIVNYVYDILDDSDECALRNGKSAYGKGSWASSLRYNKGTFYLAVASFTTNKTYIFKTTDIENGQWSRNEFEGVYHDLSLLFDDDERVFLVYGGGTIRLIELTSDASAILPDGTNKTIIENADVGGQGGLPAEGSHLYKIDGKYYIFLIAWPASGTNRRIELCYRSDNIEGPYEGRVVIDDDLGYQNRGVAQGGIFNTPDGKWYAMLFQDHGAVGRVPVLLPVTWKDGWPVIHPSPPEPADMEICLSDEFNYSENKLALVWQWNHNPVNTLWSLTERPGFLRLKSGFLCKNMLSARNTLTQRTFGPKCSGAAKLDTSSMKSGDVAGLAALQELYGYVAVKADNGKKSVVAVCTSANNLNPTEHIITELKQECIYIKVDFDFEESDTARFYYSLDEINWQNVGDVLHMEYRLSHFTGYRFALFYYSTIETGGHADFDYFRLN